MSLKSKILDYIKSEKRVVHSGEIEDLARDLGFKSSNATRRCRELENEGFLKAVYDKKGCVSYISRPDVLMNMGITNEPIKLEFGNKQQIHQAKL